MQDFADARQNKRDDIEWIREKVFLLLDETENMC